MDRRLLFPRVLYVENSSRLAELSRIASIRAIGNGRLSRIYKQLRTEHYVTPMIEGDILDESGFPFVEFPHPIIERDRRGTPVTLYAPIILTRLDARVQRFVLRFVSRGANTDG